MSDAAGRVEKRRAIARLLSSKTLEDRAIITLDPLLEGIVLWVALVASADAAGRLEGDPYVIQRTILSELYVGTEPAIAPETIGKLLKQMSETRTDPDEGQEIKPLLYWYKLGRRQHIELCNFSKHQHGLRFITTSHPGPPGVDRPSAAPTIKQQVQVVARRLYPQIEGGVAVPGPLMALHSKIKEVYGSGPEADVIHRMAGMLYKKGLTHPDAVMEAIALLQKAGGRIRNPWAYLKSTGFLSTALSRGVEAAAAEMKNQELKYKPTEVRGGDMQSISSIMARALPKTK